MADRQDLKMVMAAITFPLIMFLAYVIVNQLGDLVLWIAGGLTFVGIAYFAARSVSAQDPITYLFVYRPMLLVVSVVITIVVIALLIWILAPIVKILAWLLLGMVLYSLFLRYYAPKLSREVESFVFE